MKTIHKKIKIIFLLLIFVSTSAQALDHIYTSYFSSKAVSGYDVIAYFDEQKPVKGKSEYQISYKNANWFFSSQSNLEKFKANPEQYAPQYGGYCAWAMASNDDAPGNTPFWNIYNGKLYLNYNQEIMDKWTANKDEFIKQADIHWANKKKD